MRNHIAAALLFCFALLIYITVMLPIGLATSFILDPLRLRFRRQRASYFRSAPHSATEVST